MTVLMISPGYPAEMAFFTRGLGQAGVRVIGLGDQAPDALPAEAQGALDHYVHTGSLAAEDHVAGLVREMARRIRIDQVECLWEPYMVLAARLREELGLPGLTVEQTVPFRDKERMKQLLDAAGLRTPWHVAARTWAAGTVYLRGQGAGQVRGVHGLDALPPEVTALVVDSRLPRAGQPSSGSYEGDGWITIRHPDTAAVTAALKQLVSTVRVELG